MDGVLDHQDLVLLGHALDLTDALLGLDAVDLHDLQRRGRHDAQDVCLRRPDHIHLHGVACDEVKPLLALNNLGHCLELGGFGATVAHGHADGVAYLRAAAAHVLNLLETLIFYKLKHFR